MKINKIIILCLVLLSGYPIAHLRAQTPEAPLGKVWILNPEMSDEFEADGPGSMWKIYDKADSWDRTAAFDKRVQEIQRADVNGEENYVLAMNPMWYEEEDIFTKNGRTYYFAGGGMSTKARTIYGYMEVRIKPSNFPMGSGVFMFSNSSDDPCGERYSTELDIIENMSYDGPGASEHWNGYQHVNTHVWPTDEGCNRLPSNMYGGNKRTLEGPLDFNVVGAHWKSKDSVDFYLNGKYWHSVAYEAHFDLSMPLILTMETYTWGSDENNADNPKPEEYMFQDDFRTRDERAVYYDWVRTWKLADIDTSEYNDRTENIGFFEDSVVIFEDSILDLSVLYSAKEEREIAVAVYNGSWELLGTDTTASEFGVKSLLARISTDTILGAGGEYKAICTLRPIGADDDPDIAADTVQVLVNQKDVETLVLDDGFPKQVFPSSEGYLLDVYYQGADNMEIAVEVRDPSGAWIGGGLMDVPDGDGLAQIWAGLIEPTLIGSGYSWKSHIRPRGTTWRESVHGLSFLPFTVIKEAVNEIELVSEAWPLWDTVQSVEAAVQYGALETADLSIYMLKGDSVILSDTALQVETGSAGLTFDLLFPSDPLPGADYMLIAQLHQNGTDTLLATDTLKNLVVLELLPELHLLAEGWPLADTAEAYLVDVSYIAREASDLNVSLRKSEELVHDTLIAVSGGSGLLSLQFIFAEKPEPGSDYWLTGTLLLGDQHSAIAGDTLENLEILEIKDPVGFSPGSEEHAGRIRIYPNPASGRIRVDIPESLEQVESIHITDINGRVVLQSSENPHPDGKTEIHLNISSLQPGYYFLNCKADKSPYSVGFIVE